MHGGTRTTAVNPSCFGEKSDNSKVPFLSPGEHQKGHFENGTCICPVWWEGTRQTAVNPHPHCEMLRKGCRSTRGDASNRGQPPPSVIMHGGTRTTAVNPHQLSSCTGGRVRPRSTPSNCRHARGDAYDRGQPPPTVIVHGGTRTTAVNPHQLSSSTGGRVRPRSTPTNCQHARGDAYDRGQPPPTVSMHGGTRTTAVNPLRIEASAT
jgi:hypothetical protein